MIEIIITSFEYKKEVRQYLLSFGNGEIALLECVWNRKILPSKGSIAESAVFCVSKTVSMKYVSYISFQRNMSFNYCTELYSISPGQSANFLFFPSICGCDFYCDFFVPWSTPSIFDFFLLRCR